MNAVIYARYSSDNQREESIEGQIRECKEFAEKKDITIIANYIDRAFSARTADRPEFQRMIRDSEKGLFDAVLVWKLDRFSRDRYDSAHYKHILKKNGVRLISAKENISEGPEGIILESMLEGMAEYYSAELSQKIKRGQKENAMKCKNNGSKPPYGYYVNNEGYLVINENQAPVVKDIFNRYDRGETITEIVNALNAAGFRCSTGKKFTVGRISFLLKNRKYIGEYKYGDIVIPGGIPAIIDKAQFDRVRHKMLTYHKAPGKFSATVDYLLSTKLYCGTCGCMMNGECGRGRNNITYHYYKCSGAKRHKGCHRKALKKDWIETKAVEITVNRVLTDSNIESIAEAIVEMQGTEDPVITSLKKQLSECETAINNIVNAIQSGIVTESTKDRLESLEEEKKSIRQSINKALLERPIYTKDQIVAWISRFKYGDINDKNYQREVIDTFLHSIYVYDDKLVLTYNYKDGVTELPFDVVKNGFVSTKENPCLPSKNYPNPVFFKTAFGFVFPMESLDELYERYCRTI